MNAHIIYYDLMFALSAVLTLIFSAKWNKRMDAHIVLVYIFCSLGTLGQFSIAHSQNLEAAIISNRFVYLAGCFGTLFIMMCSLSFCGIRIGRIPRILLVALTMAIFMSMLSIGKNEIFYRSVDFQRINGEGMLVNKVYGPLHTVFYIMLIGYTAVPIIVMIYSLIKKPDVSRHMISLLILPEALGLFSFFGGRILGSGIELVPIFFVFAQLIYLIIISRISLYDVTYTGVDSLVSSASGGIVSFDSKLRYLASDDEAKRIMPELCELTADRSAAGNVKIKSTLLNWIELYNDDKFDNSFHYISGDKAYLVNIIDLYTGGKKRGYQIFFMDDTKHQQYVDLLDRYNSDLKKEVEEKTQHIVEMHENLVLSMATMVESRDNSTGGHIRRTSEGVRLLMNEICKDDLPWLDGEFRRCIIKAAPMHDLGKIAVDDAVLRKPGRFTPEEFEKMKAHAAEGARIVHEILKNTDDERFKTIAENVAHYHHERVDGSGYPDGLKGDEIPIEARIMAIADVYDALVSKRVYKDSMSFDEADRIIMESMGRHFDKQLEKYYVAARPHLEAYYSSLG